MPKPLRAVLSAGRAREGLRTVEVDAEGPIIAAVGLKDGERIVVSVYPSGAYRIEIARPHGLASPFKIPAGRTGVTAAPHLQRKTIRGELK